MERCVTWSRYFLTCCTINTISLDDAVALFNGAGVLCKPSAFEWKAGRGYQFVRFPPEMTVRSFDIVKGLKINGAPLTIEFAKRQSRWSTGKREHVTPHE